MKKIYYILLFGVFSCYAQDVDMIYSSAGLDSQAMPKESISEFQEFIFNNATCLKVGVNYYVSFIVERDGSLTNLKYLQPEKIENFDDCNVLIKKAFESTPKWNPGMFNKKSVRVLYSLPLLKKDENNNNNTNSNQEKWIINEKQNVINSEITSKLDGLKSGDFIPFPIIQEGEKQEIGYYDYELWKGELFIKGSTIFNPRCGPFAFGYSVYDISKMQYGRIVYSVDASCFNDINYKGIIPSNNKGNYFYSYCKSDVYKTLLIEEDYSKYEYYQANRAISGSGVRGINYTQKPFFQFPNENPLEFERNGKIYTFYETSNSISNYKSDFINFNRNNNFATCTKIKGEHDKMEYILVSSYKEAKRTSKKIININNIINDIDSPLLVNKSYSEIIACKKEYSWIIDNIYLFNDDKILVVIYCKDNNNSGFKGGLPIQLGSTYEIALLLDNKMEYLNSSKIISGDYTIISQNSNNFYQVIKDGAKVVCYDNNINVKWYKELGFENNKNVGEISFTKEVKNSLYLMGTHSNKYHVGYPDPIVWKINSINGDLIQEDVMKEKNSVQGSLNGFLFHKNNLFLVLPSSIIDRNSKYQFKKSSTILKKTNIIVD